MMNDQKFRMLTRKYISDQCTDGETILFFKLVNDGGYDFVLKDEIGRVKCMDKVDGEENFTSLNHVFDRLLENIK